MQEVARKQARQWLANLAEAMGPRRLVIVSGNHLLAGVLVWTYPGEVLRAASLADLGSLLQAADESRKDPPDATSGIDPSVLWPLPQQILPIVSDPAGSLALESDHLVFLLCDDLPDGEVEDALALIEAAIPASRRQLIAVVDDSCDRQRLLDFQQAGIDGLCTLGSMGQGRIYTALSALASACSYIDPVLRQRLQEPAGDGRVRSAEDLTPLERRLLRDVCRGYNSNEIAGRQGLTAQSVRRYLSHAYHRLRVRDRAQAISWCFAHGVVQAADLRAMFQAPTPPAEPD